MLRPLLTFATSHRAIVMLGLFLTLGLFVLIGGGLWALQAIFLPDERRTAETRECIHQRGT